MKLRVQPTDSGLKIEGSHRFIEYKITYSPEIVQIGMVWEDEPTSTSHTLSIVVPFCCYFVEDIARSS